MAMLFAYAAACSRKPEIVPEGASRVTRSDTLVENADHPFELRSYTFQLKLPEGEASFVCEAKKYSSDAHALVAAEKSIAQRPDEQQRKNAAWYARAGLSQWLLAGDTLTWCMLADKNADGQKAAQKKLQQAFMQKFREAQ